MTVKTTVTIFVNLSSDITVGEKGVGLNVASASDTLRVYQGEIIPTSDGILPDIVNTIITKSGAWIDAGNTPMVLTGGICVHSDAYTGEHRWWRTQILADQVGSDITLGYKQVPGKDKQYIINLKSSLNISAADTIVINLYVTADGYSTTALALLDDPEAAPAVMDTEPETEESERTTENATVPSETGTTEASTEGQTNAEESTEPSTEGQTAVTESEKQTEDTEPATEGQTTLPETEKQTETAEPSTEGQTQPSQTESQTETSAPQTEKQSETDAAQPESPAETAQTESEKGTVGKF